MQIAHLAHTLRGYGGIYVDCAAAIELIFETQHNLHNAGSAFLRVVKALAALGDRHRKRRKLETTRRAAARRNSSTTHQKGNR